MAKLIGLLMKTCCTCKETKPLDQFYKNSGAKDGYQARCKKCGKEDQRKRYTANPGKLRDYERKRYVANPERKKANSGKRYAANTEAAKKYGCDWRQANPERTKETARRYGIIYRELHSEQMREGKIKQLYSITADEYFSRLMEQGGKCAICRSDTPGRGNKHFSIDHCHKTGNVRGLLCDRCNRGLGMLREDVTILEAAVSYLAQHRVNE